MTLEFTDRQHDILKDSLRTRLYRIEEMIKLFEADSDERAAFMIETYRKEQVDVEHLLDVIKRAVLSF